MWHGQLRSRVRSLSPVALPVRYNQSSLAAVPATRCKDPAHEQQPKRHELFPLKNRYRSILAKILVQTGTYVATLTSLISDVHR